MQYRKRKIQAGKTMLVEVGPDCREGKSKPRGKRQNPTPEAVANYNEKLAEKKLRLLLNHNFGAGDYHLVLTYEGQPPTVEEGKRNLRNFLRRATRAAVKEELELRYIAVTEWQAHRIHHHIIVGGLSAREATKQWLPHGHAHITYLYPDGDYGKLAAYLIKETKQSLRAGLITKRWSGSKNLKQPDVKEKTVKRWNLSKTPKEYKHYKLLDWENVVNPVTGTLSQWAYYLRI